MTGYSILSERIQSGKYTINDLQDLLRSFVELKFQPVAVRDVLHRVFQTRESVERLLEITLQEPDSFCELLSRYHVLVENAGTVLYKAYIIANLKLIDLKPRFKPAVGKATSSLLEAHYYVSLYNPLVMLYIALARPSSLRDAVIKPMADKIELYEANPNIRNLYIFRDALLFLSLIDNPRDTAPILYGKYEHNWIIDVIERSGIRIMESTRRLIVTSYLRVLKGLSESIRALVRGYDRLEMFKKDIYYLRNTRMALEVLGAYLEFFRSYSEKSLERLILLMNGLVGAGLSNVYDTIIQYLEKLMGATEFIRSNKYLLITFLIEMSLLEKTFNEKLIEEIETYEHIEKIANIISDAVKRVRDEVILILDQNLEPYKTLKDRIIKNKDSRYLSWLNVEG